MWFANILQYFKSTFTFIIVKKQTNISNCESKNGKFINRYLTLSFKYNYANVSPHSVLGSLTKTLLKQWMSSLLQYSFAYPKDTSATLQMQLLPVRDLLSIGELMRMSTKRDHNEEISKVTTSSRHWTDWKRRTWSLPEKNNHTARRYCRSHFNVCHGVSFRGEKQPGYMYSFPR